MEVAYVFLGLVFFTGVLIIIENIQKWRKKRDERR